MLDISNSFFYKLKLNASKVDFIDYFRPSQYNYFQGNPPIFMKVGKGHTIHIDLTQSEDEILQGCKSNTRNEIRRAIREGFFFEEMNDYQEFVDFYNVFAQEKNIEKIDMSHLTKYGKHLLLYKSGFDGNVMTMHASFTDDDIKRVTLLYSASVRLTDSIDKKMVGFSNRFLHYKEFLQFKSMGYTSYDINGVCIDQRDKARYSIGKFKQGFGGEEKDIIQLYSYPFVLFNFILKWIR